MDCSLTSTDPVKVLINYVLNIHSPGSGEGIINILSMLNLMQQGCNKKNWLEYMQCFQPNQATFFQCLIYFFVRGGGGGGGGVSKKGVQPLNWKKGRKLDLPQV